MSIGTIVSGGTDGQYSVDVEFDAVAIQNRITLLTTRKTNAEIAKTSAEAVLADLQAEYDALIAEQNALIDILNADKTEENLKALQAKSRELVPAAANVAKQSFRVKTHTLEIAGLSAEIARLLGVPSSVNATLWCADLTENLSGEVGLVEVPGGERGKHIQILPGHGGVAAYSAARDGVLRKPFADDPSGTYYNLALLPGWQKWYPRYRLGVISNIDTDLDTCSVQISSAISGQQGINVNHATSYDDVPIEYLTCNAEAFEDGDSVLVEFANQSISGTDTNWNEANLKVIGFETNPKDCGSYRLLVYATSQDDPYGWSPAGVPLSGVDCDINPLRAYNASGSVSTDPQCFISSGHAGNTSPGTAQGSEPTGYWISPNNRVMSWGFSLMSTDDLCYRGNADSAWEGQIEIPHGESGINVHWGGWAIRNANGAENYCGVRTGYGLGFVIFEHYLVSAPGAGSVFCYYQLSTGVGLPSSLYRLVNGVFSPSGNKHAVLSRNRDGNNQAGVTEVTLPDTFGNGANIVSSASLIAEDFIVDVVPYTKTPLGDGTTRERIQFQREIHRILGIGYTGETLVVTWGVLRDEGDYVVDVDESTIDTSDTELSPADPVFNRSCVTVANSCSDPPVSPEIYVVVPGTASGTAWELVYYLENEAAPDYFVYEGYPTGSSDAPVRPHSVSRVQTLEIRSNAAVTESYEIYNESRPERAPRYGDFSSPSWIAQVTEGAPAASFVSTLENTCGGLDCTDPFNQPLFESCCNWISETPPDDGTIISTANVSAIKVSSYDGVVANIGAATVANLGGFTISTVVSPTQGISDYHSAVSPAEVSLSGSQAAVECGSIAEVNSSGEWTLLTGFPSSREIPAAGSALIASLNTLADQVFEDWSPSGDYFALARDLSIGGIVWSVRLDFEANGGVNGVHNYVNGWNVSWIPSGGSLVGKTRRGFVEWPVCEAPP